ncbi:hypothetical protein ACJX0J_027363, partial [Zea mays]
MSLLGRVELRYFFVKIIYTHIWALFLKEKNVACTRDSSRATNDEWFLIQGLKKCLCVLLFQILSLESAPQQAQELQVNLITQVLLHFTKIDIHLHTIITSQDQKTSDDPVFFILCNSKKGNSSNCREGSSNNILKDGAAVLYLSKTCWDKNSLILVKGIITLIYDQKSNLVTCYMGHAGIFFTHVNLLALVPQSQQTQFSFCHIEIYKEQKDILTKAHKF